MILVIARYRYSGVVRFLQWRGWCSVFSGKIVSDENKNSSRNSFVCLYICLYAVRTYVCMYHVCCVFCISRYDNSEVIGTCAVGQQIFGVGRDHWTEMLANARKPVAQWHRLMERSPSIDSLPAPFSHSLVNRPL